MSIARSILFVDGENLVFRYQSMLSKGAQATKDVIHVPDVFVWHPEITSWCMMNLVRVYYYTSMVGDDQSIQKMKDSIADVMYEYLYAEGRTGTARIVPLVFKKAAKSYKTRQVDIHITIDMMRFAHNGSIELLYLASGDGDYVPLLQEIMRHGKEMYVAAFSSGLAKEMRSSVDEFLDLDKVFFAQDVTTNRDA